MLRTRILTALVLVPAVLAALLLVAAAVFVAHVAYYSAIEATWAEGLGQAQIWFFERLKTLFAADWNLDGQDLYPLDVYVTVATAPRMCVTSRSAAQMASWRVGSGAWCWSMRPGMSTSVESSSNQPAAVGSLVRRRKAVPRTSVIASTGSFAARR